MFDVGEAPNAGQTIEKEANLDPIMAKFEIPPTIIVDFSVNGTAREGHGQLNVKNPLGSVAYFKFTSDMMYTPYIFFDKKNKMVNIEPGDTKTVEFTAVVSDQDTVQEYRRDVEIMIFIKDVEGEFKILRTFLVPAYINVQE
jgi:hypothetical protein